MDYLDFNLEIGQGGPETYPVSVDSPGGQAEQEMHFPFGDSELENKLLALENALLRSGGSHRGISPQEQTVRDFGERLFKAILTGDVKTRYEVSLREARRQNKGLRLKLRIQPPKLALLPWEFLYDPDGGDYLCFSASTPLVRYVDLRRPVEQLPITPPLRILGMVASPTDLPQLDVDKEKRLVEESIKFLRAKGLVELTWLEEQTWSALQEAMWGGPWHIFHFVGHGDFDRNNGEGRVAFSDEAGRQVVLPARNLARLLDDHRDLRLAFLNSCEGARGSEGDPFSGTAATLVRRGIPAVVAMQYQITDNAAIAFSRAFYHAVANNLPVDAAVAAARTAVSMYDTLEWGTPVLYMRSPDGRLFDIKRKDREEEEPLRRYREVVEKSWTSEELHEREAEKLKNIADNELKLTSSTAADIEREVMGETKEAFLERQEQAAKERYRKAVEEVWADNELNDAEVERLRILVSELGVTTDAAADIEREVTGDTVQAITQHQTEEEASRRYREAIDWVLTGEDLNQRQVRKLGNLADRLKLSASAAAAIEREVMGETKETILQRQEQAAKESEHKERLEALYARARSLHRDQNWQAVVDVFEQISAEDQDYPDPEGLLQSAREALKRVRKEQDALRRYREAVKSTSKEGLNERRAHSLRDLANELDLSASAASRIEQEVMDDTKEAILERLEGLYGEARQLHQNREWQAVIDIFARIYLVDANYPDPEGLLASAHEALETARKEEESLRQYREVVEAAWSDGELDSREVERLRDLADKLNLSPNNAGEIERTVIGDTKEAILESQERAAKERYRNVVEDAWADNHVSDTETEQLGALARELDLSMDTVVDIERDVMGDTKEAILERQEQAARKKARLDELYARARRSHQDQDWQKVVDLFEQISAEDPAYPDQERLLASAREALEAQKQEQRVAADYAEGLRHMDAREWQQALECFEEVLLLEPGYRDVGTQLSQARAELSRLQPLTADRIQCVRMLTEHKKAVNAVAFSPDGQLLASCSGGVWRSDDTVRLWRVENGELLHALKGHKSVVTSVAFSPSGELLASGSGDGTVRLWRVQNGELLHILDGHRGSVESVAFSPGGELLASGSGDRMVRLWRVQNGEYLYTLEGHGGWVESVAFSPGGELLASGSGDRMVRLWRVEGGELLRTLEGHTNVVASVAFSPGGELLASGSEDKTVRLWGMM